MRKLLIFIGRIISQVIDIFYPPFKRYVSLQFFRYGVTGVVNLIFSWFMYFFIYQFVIQKRMINFGFVTLSGHTSSLIINFVIVLFTGFLLQKYVTFTASELRGGKQLVRYIEVGLFNLFVNYIGLKISVEYLALFPSVANIIVSIVTTVISYFLQKKYTFRINAAG